MNGMNDRKTRPDESADARFFRRAVIGFAIVEAIAMIPVIRALWQQKQERRQRARVLDAAPATTTNQ